MIAEELLSVQGQRVDLGGYYRPDPEKVTAVMRPSRPSTKLSSPWRRGTRTSCRSAVRYCGNGVLLLSISAQLSFFAMMPFASLRFMAFQALLSRGLVGDWAAAKNNLLLAKLENVAGWATYVQLLDSERRFGGPSGIRTQDRRIKRPVLANERGPCPIESGVVNSSLRTRLLVW